MFSVISTPDSAGTVNVTFAFVVTSVVPTNTLNVPPASSSAPPARSPLDAAGTVTDSLVRYALIQGTPSAPLPSLPVNDLETLYVLSIVTSVDAPGINDEAITARNVAVPLLAETPLTV